jgi:hypothetical protein
MTLSGRGALHRNLQRTNYLEDILGHCRDIGRDLSPLVWVDKIERRTQPPVDVEHRRRSQDFVGDLLRITAEYRKDGSRLDRLREAVAPLYEHRRCRKWLARMDDEALMCLLEEAEIECLDRLMEEDSP